MTTQQTLDTIFQQIEQIEREHDVVVLYAVEGGSRLWGYDSPASDHDLFFLYVHRLDWYLKIGEHRDTSLSENRDVIEHKIPGFDFNGWDLRKTMDQLHRCSPTLMEWLLVDDPYTQYDDVIYRLKDLGHGAFSTMKLYNRYMSIAKRNFKEYLEGANGEIVTKKYLHTLRPLLAAQWVSRFATMPPMDFKQLALVTVGSQEILSAIDLVLKHKKHGEDKMFPVWEIHDYVDEVLKTSKPTGLTQPQVDITKLDAYFADTVKLFYAHWPERLRRNRTCQQPST